MTSTILTIGIPTLAVLVGILMNRNDANQIRAEIGQLRSETRNEIGQIRGEISTARKQSHDDVIMLMGVVRDLDIRTTRLEGRH